MPLAYPRRFATALTAALLATSASAASFIPLDSPFGLRPLAMSADGSALVGSDNSIRGFMWHPGTGVQFANSLDTRYPYAVLWDVTPDGAIAVGHTEPATCCGRVAGTWTAAGGWVTLPSTDPTGSSRDNGTAISDDGRIIVGHRQPVAGPDQPLVWRDGVLATPAGLPLGAHPHEVSADGSVIIGRRYGLPNTESAFLWSEASGYLTLTPIGACCNSAWAMTPDGSVVVGSYTPTGGNTEAFRWTSADGLVGLGMPAGLVQTYANDISGDGLLIVGGGRRADNAVVATLWDPVHGMRLLQDILEGELQLDLADWQLKSADAISRDGRFIAGTAVNAQGRDVAWVADLTPVPAPPAAWLLASAFGTIGCFKWRRS